MGVWRCSSPFGGVLSLMSKSQPISYTLSLGSRARLREPRGEFDVPGGGPKAREPHTSTPAAATGLRLSCFSSAAGRKLAGWKKIQLFQRQTNSSLHIRGAGYQIALRGPGDVAARFSESLPFQSSSMQCHRLHYPGPLRCSHPRQPPRPMATLR